ncbi:S8 family serine peptidase [Pseudomonas sp. 8 R 14]|uniref:S8 family serine peptidase n=1 Tax=Pseudomonas sp. 8 R 14 TaxID=1844092 RepID=UPI0008127F61|nr:S8 family serine peptidase [Pseudomonas sp. 8 R 14]CRM76720.1 type VII secretion-associated serine protease mycosin [Pseudomonas sp. 8 R 14]
MPAKPIINPIVIFLKKPTPKGVTGGGKNAKGIKKDSLQEKRENLSKHLINIDARDLSDVTFSGVTHLIAKMDDDALSPTWTPTDLFDSRVGCRLISPGYKGFIIEINRKNLADLSKHIKSSTNIKDQVDISRISKIEIFDELETFRGSSQEDLWSAVCVAGSANIWLKPFKNTLARKALALKIKELLNKEKYILGHPEYDSPPSANIMNYNAIDELIEAYIDRGNAAFSLQFSSKEAFQNLVASGTVYRIEPAPQVTVSQNPGVGSEPSPKKILSDSPTVVIIDGGVNAPSYLHLEKISILPLVDNSNANLIHGNKVASLVCHAYAWNNQRPLPELDCTYISAQVICKDSVPKTPNHHQLLRYLEDVAQKTAGYAKVWNLSFNTVASLTSTEEVSLLGHRLSKLARKYNILPVISAGNRDHNPTTGILCPPADCEASLSISGRQFNEQTKKPGEKCLNSLKGPAPAGMKKPDLAWYSELRVLGGRSEIGTSFSTPLVSSLAAHTFSNVKNATPDLVRALLINRAELYSHSNGLGWGTPWEENKLPWHCPPGDITMVWSAELKPGYWYYWTDIPIPPEFIKNGKFVGTVVLTAVLEPLVSDMVGENYFSSRVQTALQAKSEKGATINLAGSMKEDKEKEATARSELAKWSPVRNHCKLHTRTGISGTTMRLNARIFARDLYQFDVNHHSELPAQKVSFVLTLRSSDKSDSVYDSAVRAMAADIESAVIDQDIQISL